MNKMSVIQKPLLILFVVIDGLERKKILAETFPLSAAQELLLFGMHK